ncbi:translocation/assembly module TamB domain-containing protein [Sporomusa aerivorans]|uniref:translocation/assembly module TamB domain-containing protein n=1 Tax=Sporomusa aerivorans TaxID=204936 RepID=UPI00352AA6C6
MRTKAIILTIIVFVAGASVFGWWSVYGQTVFARIESTLATEMTTALGTRVDIGQVQMAGITTAAVNDITIFDKQGREMAVVEKAIIEYSLLSLVRGQAALSTVRKVTLARPRLLLVEETDNTWNTEFLKQETKDGSPKFSGEVAIEEGAAEIRSAHGNWDFSQVNGRLDISENQAIVLNLAANHNDSPWQLQGTIGSGTNNLALTIKADALQPTAYQGLLPAGSEVEFTAGKLTKLTVTLVKDTAGLRYAGEFALQDLAAKVSEMPVTGANGQVSFTNNTIYILGANALIADQPVTASGKIAIAGDLPVLDLHMTSTGFDPSVLNHNLPFTGKVAFSADITGISNNPMVAAELKVADGNVAGYPVQTASAKVKFADKLVHIEQLTAHMAEGQVRGQGDYSVETQQVQIQLAATDIQLAAFAGLPVSASGRGDISLTLSGYANDWNSLQGSVAITLKDGQVEGMPYSQTTGFIEKSGSILKIRHFDMVLPSGLIMAAGEIQDDKLALRIGGQGVELAEFPFATLSGYSLAGNTRFRGQVSGTTAQPQLNMNFTSDNFSINQEILGQAEGTITASPDRVSLEKVTIVNGAASHELAGNILLAGSKPELNITLTTHAARAETFARMLLPELKLTGNLEHQVTVSGPLDDLNIRGTVSLAEGSLAGYLIARAEGTYSRQNGMITVENLTAQSLETTVKLSGTVAPDHSLNFAVNAVNIDASRLKADYPYPVGGMFNLNGRITGSIASPKATGLVTSNGILINGQELKNISANLSYQDGQGEIAALRFAQGDGTFEFTGGFNINTHDVDGNLQVAGGELAGLLAIANVPDRGIHGKLNGEIVLHGNINNPTIFLRGAIANGKIKNYPLDNVDVDVALANKVITINKFMAKQGIDGVLVAQGQADLNGKIALEVGGRSIDTGILAALFDTSVETKGQFSFNAQATGLTADPNVAVSLEVAKGSIANTEFDNLYGLLVFNKGSIHVNQLFVARGPYKASAYGIVPLRALNSQGRSKADITDTMDLKLRLDNADLSILPLLSKEVAWAAGPTTGEIDIGGTLAQPVLDGKVTVTDGTIKLKALNDPIQNVGVDIQFKGDKIDVNTFNGKMGSGSYSLTGSARVNGLAFDDYNLTLTLNRLGIKHKYYTGPIDGIVTLKSQSGNPKLFGRLTVDDATINIPAVPEGNALAFDADLDVELVIGDKVRFYNPYLYDFRADGTVKISGTLQRPDAQGRIEARRGTVKYLTNRFTIVSGSAEFPQYRSIVPVIKLQAQAKLSRTTINLAVNGPATAMELDLTSTPAMSQQEIISLLTLRGSYFTKNDSSGTNRDSSFGRDELVSLLDAGLQMRFVAEVESVLQDALGVDELQLVRSSLFDNSRSSSKDNDQFQGYNIQIGKYLTDKFLISYSMGLDQHENSFGFRYDLTKNIGLGGSIGGASKRQLTVETRFAF